MAKRKDDNDPTRLRWFAKRIRMSGGVKRNPKQSNRLEEPQDEESEPTGRTATDDETALEGRPRTPNPARSFSWRRGLPKSLLGFVCRVACGAYPQKSWWLAVSERWSPLP